MKQLSLNWSDDYAVLEAGKLMFYYGYEHIDNGQYNFIVFENNKMIFTVTEEFLNKISNNHNMNYMNDYLLLGIGYYNLIN